MKKPKINYPCEWEYKIIGAGQELMEEAAAKVIADRNYRITFSRKSKKGKYLSLNVKTKVFDQADRDRIFSDFSSHPEIQIVL